MAKPVECEILIAINDDGDWVVCHADEDAVVLLNDTHGAQTLRVVKITATITPPSITEVAVAVPDEAGETITATAE